MGAVKDLSEPMLQGKEDVQVSSECSVEVKGSEKQMQLGDLLVKEKHEEGIKLSSQWSGQMSMNGTGTSSPLRELLKKQKLEEEFHDVIEETSTRSRPPRARLITLYHLSLFKFERSCRSPAAPDATSSPNSLRQLFKKEKARGTQSYSRHQEGSGDFWLKKAMRRTILVLKNLSFSVQRCYRTSSGCCEAGLNYGGLANSSAGGRRISQRRTRRQESAERERVRNHFATPLDSVRETRSIDCSRDQCGWSQEYSSPAQFSWESSTPVYNNNSSHQLVHRHQQHPAQSIISTITTTTELLCYSSNLMTPYEIHHSFRRTFNVDDRKSRPEADS